jgi:transcriptional regulator of acetoin/glycerol metabolism
VAEGRFREDLYYRLNGAVFLPPPLREREDIGTVIDRVLHEEAQAMSRELRLADETRDALMRHPWPGNIRQLRHAMRYACAISDGPLLMPQSFPPDLFNAAPSTLMRAAPSRRCRRWLRRRKPRRLPSSPRIWRCANACSKPCAATSGR